MENENEQKIVKEPAPKKPKDNRTISEKIEDGMDSVVGGVQDILYGEHKSIKTDIPATMETSSGIRKVNKIQTRSNLNRRLFGRKGMIILGIIIVIGLVVSLGYYFIEKLLLA